MSGGSYNYLYGNSVGSLLDEEVTIQAMADRLAGLGYADDAAKETQDLLLSIRQFKNRIGTMSERLSGVWQTIEWWDSGDSGEETFKKALMEYRK